MSSITPPEGVRAFIKRFGGPRHIMSAASSMGLTITYAQINNWKESGLIPEHFYHALNTIIAVDETSIAKGFIEFYVKGKPIGKFYLHKDVSAVIRRRRR